MANSKNAIRTILEMVKFGLVGVMNTLITYLVITLLTLAFNAHYTVANIVGYVLGFINSFIMNRIWTFKSKGDVKKEIVLFILVFAVCYLLQFLLLVALNELAVKSMKDRSFSGPLFDWVLGALNGLKLKITPQKLTELLLQFVCMVFYTVIGFFGNKFITFRKPKE